MTPHFTLKSICLVATLALLPAVNAASMSKAEFTAAKSRIEADYKTDRTACAGLAGNAKDVCVERAKARERIGYADLDYRHTATAADHYKLLVARAETTYAVAKEQCDDQAGNAKDVCVKEAKAAERTALANAKLGKEVDASVSDANSTKRDAAQDVASEKCESLAGDAKTSCLAAAKTTPARP